MNDEQIAHFWSKVFKTEDCWFWCGAKNPKGYGLFYANGKQRGAHRIAYELLKGPIPAGMTLDHLCRVRPCVNPAHVEVVTNRENVLRGVGHTAINARKTHCIRGHVLIAENLIKGKDRRCKQCDHILGARYRAKRKLRNSNI